MTSRMELYSDFIGSWQYVAKLPDGQFEIVVGPVRFVLKDLSKAERLYNKLIEIEFFIDYRDTIRIITTANANKAENVSMRNSL